MLIHTPAATKPSTRTTETTRAGGVSTSRGTRVTSRARIIVVATGMSTADTRHGNNNAKVSLPVATWSSVSTVMSANGTASTTKSRVRHVSAIPRIIHAI